MGGRLVRDVEGLIVDQLDPWSLTQLSQVNRYSERVVAQNLKYQVMREAWDLTRRGLIKDPFVHLCAGGYLRWAQERHQRANLSPVVRHLAFIQASWQNHFEVQEWLWSLGVDDYQNHFSSLVERNRLVAAKWLYAKDPRLQEMVGRKSLQLVASWGWLPMAQFVWEIRPEIDRHYRANKMFRKVCGAGQFPMAQWLYSLGGVTISSADLIEACLAGCQPLVEWLYSLNPALDLSENNYSAFQMAALKQHLSLAQWLYSLAPVPASILPEVFRRAVEGISLPLIQWIYSLDPSLSSREPSALFHRICHYGVFETAQWFQALNPEIDLRIASNGAFIEVCYRGDLQWVQWLYSLDPTINFHDQGEIALYYCCLKGHLELLHWIHSLQPNFNYQVEDNRAFQAACSNGHWGIAQWLLEQDLTILTRTNRDRAFVNACASGHFGLARWLWELDPTIDLTTVQYLAYRTTKQNYPHIYEWLCYLHLPPSSSL